MDLVFHPRFIEHEQHAGHPERPERLMVVFGSLARAELDPPMHEPKPIDIDLLESVHPDEHILRLKSIGEGYYDADTYVRRNTVGIALLAAGSAPMAVDIAEEAGTAFALTRPPGHHAGKDYAGGFCYLNNVALGAEYARRKHSRVAIVDIDVHHGNGTADIFKDREDVLYISTHQSGIFPGTGALDDVGIDAGEGFTVNLPFPSGSGDGSFAEAMERIVIPALEQFDPGALMVSIGVDAHYTDPLATLGLSTNGYLSMAEALASFAKDSSIGMSYFLEGGYSLVAMSEVVGNIIASDMDESIPVEHNDGYDESSGTLAVKRCAGVQSSYWDIDTS